MKYLLCSLLTLFSLPCFAETIDAFYRDKITHIADLYGDGQASLVNKSFRHSTIVSTTSNASECVNLVSFVMEGFSGGNNSAQFIVFFSCRSGKGDADSTKALTPSVTGIHAFYHHRNYYDIQSATLSGNSITINSPKGEATFSRKYSIWWSGNEQMGI